MKIALPSRDGQVDNHFGHCEYFTIVEVSEEMKVLKQERLDAPEGCGCKSNVASILKDKGVTLMLAGNMGDGAVNVLHRQGIEVIRGCQGKIEQVVTEYLKGNVTDSNIVCDHHECHHEKADH